MGLGLLYRAVADGGSWDLSWHDAVLGLAVVPAIVLTVGMAARRYGCGPVRFTGPLGLAVNTAVIVALVTIGSPEAANQLNIGLFTPVFMLAGAFSLAASRYRFVERAG